MPYSQLSPLPHRAKIPNPTCEQALYVLLAVVSDEGYAIPTITMLTSARYNKSPERSYIIHVLGNNLSEFAKRKLGELERPDFSLRFYACSSEQYKHCYISPTSYYDHSCMIKCELAELLPQLG